MDAANAVRRRCAPALKWVQATLVARVCSRPWLSTAAAVLIAVGWGVGLLLDPPGSSYESRALSLPDQPPTGTSASAAGTAAVGAAQSAEPPQTTPQARPHHTAGATGTQPGPNGYQWQPVEVKRGDTLATIFRRQSLTPQLVHEVVHLNHATRELARLMPGEKLEFAFDRDGDFQALRRNQSEAQWLLVERADDDLAANLVPRDMAQRLTHASGVIDESLFEAGREAGLSDPLIMRLARIFGWDIDFILNIRAGDRFSLVYEELWRDGEFLRDGDILAATFVNQGRTFHAVRYDAGNGPQYFAPDGRPMRKAFLRAPLNFTRVTSNFSRKRYHPILKRMRPHNGVDYGAPAGTPVYAAGAGTVIEAGRNGPNGNYVFIRHSNEIVTKYLHFSRRAARRGQKVEQGQVIGYVGATGWATAPHLHYEFVVNGVHRNPRTVDLPEVEPLPEALMPEFRRKALPLLAQLENLAGGGSSLDVAAE